MGGVLEEEEGHGRIVVEISREECEDASQEGSGGGVAQYVEGQRGSGEEAGVIPDCLPPFFLPAPTQRVVQKGLFTVKQG